MPEAPANLIPVRRCLPPAGWLTLVPRLPRWLDTDASPTRAELTPTLLASIETVQRRVQRRLVYRTDKQTYGVEDRWEVPGVTTKLRAGDCEDFAIAKYFALRKLGFKKEELRLVILMDTIRGIGHAVLAYYTKDEILILDSLSNLILPHSRYKHYVPQYSRKETTRWAHLGSFQKKKPEVYRGLLAKKPK